MGKKHQNKSQVKDVSHHQTKEKSISGATKKSQKLSPQKRNEVNQLVDKLLKGDYVSLVFNLHYMGFQITQTE